MPEITCPCGTLVDTDATPGENCPRCQTNLRDYMGAHIPVRPETEETAEQTITRRMGHCPECGTDLVMAEGCCHCMLCGWSACG